MHCYFVSDLHGSIERYKKLFDLLGSNPPDVLFLGGDLLPHRSIEGQIDFIENILKCSFQKLRTELNDKYPRVLIILGNDDARIVEGDIIALDSDGIWEYIHEGKAVFDNFTVFGYSNVPPTPFLFKDWERYDVSKDINPRCIPFENGRRTVPIDEKILYSTTIAGDLEKLTEGFDPDKSILLIHTPPYKTNLDLLANRIPVGSVAVRRFIEKYQPKLSLHGHIHESACVSGSWMDKIGETFCFSAAHDGPKLAVVQFDIENLEDARRVLI